MTGMERNSDVVVMASYAPLFVNVNHKRWNPDLINFDSSRVYGTAVLLRADRCSPRTAATWCCRRPWSVRR